MVFKTISCCDSWAFTVVRSVEHKWRFLKNVQFILYITVAMNVDFRTFKLQNGCRSIIKVYSRHLIQDFLHTGNLHEGKNIHYLFMDSL